MNRIHKRLFHSFTQQPTYSIFSHMQINSTIELYDKLSLVTDGHILSIALVASVIRLIQIPTLYSLRYITSLFKLKKRKLKDESEQFSISSNEYEKNTYPLLIKKLFINDLQIDCKHRKYTGIKYKYFKRYYSIETLLSYLLQGVLILNNLKAIYIFESIKGINTLNMISNEMFLLVFLSNYLFLKYSRHPYLMNITEVKYCYMAFAFSLLSLFFTKYACVSWIAYNLTHVVISSINYYIVNSRIRQKSITNFYKSKKTDIDKIINL